MEKGVKFDPTGHELSSGFLITAAWHSIVILRILNSLDGSAVDFLNQVFVDCFGLVSFLADRINQSVSGTRLRLDVEGIVSRFPIGSGDVSFLRSIAGVEDKPALHSVGTTWVLFRGVVRPGRESDHSLPCSTEVKNTWSSTSSPIKRKAVPLQAWTGPEVFRRLRLPNFETIGTWRW